MAHFERHSVMRWTWEAFLVLLVGFMISYTWMYGDISVPNERSRVYLTVSLFDDHTVSIDEPVKRWGKIYDLAKRDGVFYSDKAPGSSILGAVVYGVARMFTEPAEWTIQELINLMRTWLMIPISLIGFVTLRRILEYLGLDPPVIDVVSLAWILGTAAFHYGAAFYGHQIVAVALLVALYCTLRAEEEIGRRTSLWMLGAGAAAGIAGLTEYQAAIPCVLLTLYVAFGHGEMRTRGLPALVAGAAPFALLLFAYNDAAFGGPFELSYHHLADAGLREIHGEGIAGVTVPKWEYFSGSMFSMHRGLFSTAPLFLFILPGLYAMWDQAEQRLALFVGAVFAYYVAFISSSNMWFAGWGYGPRLLVPAMGLWAIAVGYGVQMASNFSWSEGLAKGLAAFQIVAYQTVTAFFPEAPTKAKNPLMDYVPRMIEADVTSPNLGQRWFGLEGLDSLKPLAAAVLVVIAIVAVRGFRLRRWTERVVVIGMMVAMGLVGASMLQTVGTKMPEKKQKRFMKHVDRWKAREDVRMRTKRESR
jgi:hypothetical protein